MKICILAPNYYTSYKKFPKRIFAPRDFIINLANGLAARRHKIYFATAPDIKTSADKIPGDKELLYKKDLTIDKYLNRRILTTQEKFLSFFSKKQYYELELIERTIFSGNSGKFDILHTDYPLVHFFEQFSKVPIVYTLHDRLPYPDTLEYWMMKKFKQHKFISISQSQKRGFADINFVGTVLHGINIKDFQFKAKASGEYMAFMGRLIPDKGAHTAVKAAEAVGIDLQIATEIVYKTTSYYSEKIAEAVNKGIAHIKGFLGKEKIDFLGQAKLLIFPIEWEEPFGLVMIEAMACGTPVVAYARGSVPEVVVDGVTGYIVNSSPSDKRGDWIVKKTGIEGLVEAVQRLNAMSEEEYKKMRIACRKHVEEKFTVERMVDGYEEVYKKILRLSSLRKQGSNLS